MNTGRVIRDVQADLLAVVEAEDRVALKQFSDYVLRSLCCAVIAGIASSRFECRRRGEAVEAELIGLMNPPMNREGNAGHQFYEAMGEARRRLRAAAQSR